MKRFIPQLLTLAALLALSACGTPPDSRNASPAPNSHSQGGSMCHNATGNSLRETMQALSLSPRQKVIWDDYQESVSKLISDQLRPENQIIRKTAIQQINAKVDTVRNRLTAMEDIVDKANALYETLDNNQKSIADRLLISTVPSLYPAINCQSDNQESEKSRMPPSGRGNPGGMGGPGSRGW